MNYSNSIFILAAIVVAVGAAIGGLAVAILYDTAFEEKRASLTRIVQSHARLIDAVAIAAKADGDTGSPKNVSVATLGAIRNAIDIYMGIGETGEFVIAKRSGGDIRFLLRHRDAGLDAPPALPLRPGFGEAMRLALSGQSGTVAGLDYRGVGVLAAYEFLENLDMGIVAKVDLAEIRAPFIKAAGIVLVLATLIAGAGVALLLRLADPLIEKISESEILFRTLMDHIPSSITLQDRDGRILLVNKAFADTRGLTAKEIIGKRHREVSSQNLADLSNKLDRLLYETGKPVTEERNLPFSDGKPFHRVVTKFPIFDASGEITGLGSIGADITELKQAEFALRESEERFRDFAMVGSDYFWEMDENLRYVSLSQRFAEITGFKIESFLGLTPRNIVAEPEISMLRDDNDTLSKGTERILSALDDHLPFREFVHPRRTKSGRVVFLSISGEPIFDDSGRFRGYRGVGRDVTSVIEAEAALRRLGTALEHVTEMVALYDADDRLVYINKPFLKTFGQKANTAIGNTFEENIDNAIAIWNVPDAIGREDEWKRNRIEQHRNPAGPIEKRRPGGVILRQTDLRLPDGGLISIAHDITDEKAAENMLRGAEQKFRSVFEDSIVGMSIQDDAGRRVMVNQAYCDMLGRTRKELEQSHISDFTHPDDVDSSIEILNEVNSRSSGRSHFEKRFLRKDGSTIWTQARISAMHVAGEKTNLAIAQVMDITERKLAEDAIRESESRFRSILDHAATGLIGIGEDGVIQFFNPAAGRMFGHEGPAVIGKNVAMLMPRADKFAHDGYLKRYLRTGDAKIIGIGREVSGLRKNGKKFPVYLGVGETQWNGKRIFIGSTTDLTRQKELEDQLRQSQKMEVVGQLTGGIAHDFNNLLATILGSLQMVQQSLPDGGRDKRRVARAIRSAKHGADLTGRLLSFSRRQAIDPKAANANRLIGGMRNLLRRALGETITIELALSEKSWTMEIDEGQFENALLNLAVNARDAMEDGGVLTIETTNYTHRAGKGRPDLAAGKYVRIAVTDTGAGMSKETLEHVFEPFFTTKERGRGTGLGLSMVHGFVHQSGGSVEMTSTPGRGACVALYLPASERALPAALEEAPRVEAMGSGEIIFVVEDDPDVLEFTSDFLSTLNYDVRRAADAGAALDLLKHNAAPELLLTDIVLRGAMNGADLAREVLRLDPSIKVLFMSGYAPVGLDLDAAAGGEAVLLHKPFEITALAHAVSDALNRGHK